MQVMNLIREFETQRMKESETAKQYADRLLDIANKVRLFGKDFSDERIIQKILVTLPEKYEATISSLENSKDLSSITLAELLNPLQALEQRRLMRNEVSVEGAYQAHSRTGDGKLTQRTKNAKNYPPCPHCKKTNHPQQRCWWRPDVQCNKCGQLGHIERVCKGKLQEEVEAKAVVDENQEEHLFVASCVATDNSEGWLIDSGCTNHMTYDRELFKKLDTSIITKVKIGNGERIAARGKGTESIESLSGQKLISEVLFVPDID